MEGALFQRAMYYAFVDIKDPCIVIYLYDMIIFSKNVVDHLGHSRQFFDKVRKFGISIH